MKTLTPIFLILHDGNWQCRLIKSGRPTGRFETVLILKCLRLDWICKVLNLAFCQAA